MKILPLRTAIFLFSLTFLPLVLSASPTSKTSIGQATMSQDGTLTLDLRAEDGKGTTGDARFVYPPSHREYQKILKHVGPIKPGETKPVFPFTTPS